MMNITKKSLCDEIFEIKTRIKKREEDLIEKYSMDAPEYLQKEAFDIIFEIEQEVSAFKISKYYSLKYFDFIEPSMDVASILEKSKRIVELVLNNYYVNFADDVMEFIFRVSKKEGLEPIKDELIKLEESISPSTYIVNHKEYEKIEKFIFFKNTCSEIKEEIKKDLKYEKMYTLIGMQKVLLQLESHFDDIETVDDINLRRASVY